MSEFTEVKSTGKPHTTFSTGSRRDNRVGKGRFDLLSPIVARRDAIHMENGARKYDARNWEKGQPLSTYLDSAERHIVSFKEGMRDEDHLAAARWNLGCLMHTQEMIKRGQLPKELDDLPNYLVNDPAGPEPRTAEAQKFAEDHLGENRDLLIEQACDGKWNVHTPNRTHWLTDCVDSPGRRSRWLPYRGGSDPAAVGIFSSKDKAERVARKAPEIPTP